MTLNYQINLKLFYVLLNHKLMNLDYICKTVIEELSVKLAQHNERELYTLYDIGSFIKSKLLQACRSYYLVAPSAIKYNGINYTEYTTYRNQFKKNSIST